MKIELTGRTVCLLGRLKGHTKASIKSTVEDAGGRVVGTPAKGGIVLVGKNPADSKMTQARARSCVMVEGDDVYALLTDGFVDVEATPTSSPDDLIGEARSVLSEGPSRAGFARLVAQLDGCDSSQLGDLVAYLEPQLASWGVAHETHETSQVHSISGSSGNLTGACAESAGHIRSTPVGWVAELIAGQVAPKLRVCDALSFSRVEVSSSAASKVLAHPTLDHLRVFDLGETNDSSLKKKTFFKKMLKSTTLATVETFVVRRCDMAGLGLLLDHPECLPALTRLDLVTNRSEIVDAAGARHPVAALARTWAHQLETLRLTHGGQVAWLADHHDTLPHLRHLIVESRAPGFANPSMWREVAERLPAASAGASHVTLAAHAFAPLESFVVALARKPPETLRVLDLSPNITREVTDTEASTLLGRAIADLALPGVLERVVVNSAFDDDLRAHAERAGIAVEVVELH